MVKYSLKVIVICNFHIILLTVEFEMVFDFVKAGIFRRGRWIGFNRHCDVLGEGHSLHFSCWWLIRGIIYITPISIHIYDFFSSKKCQSDVIIVGLNLIMQVISRSGKAEVLTDPHRPYGSSKISLNEIRRIREAGGWVCSLFFF